MVGRLGRGSLVLVLFYGLVAGILAFLPMGSLSPAYSSPVPTYVELIGHAILPADTFAPGPPAGAMVMGETHGRELPFESQPIQGLSALLPMGGGGYLALSDNGFGGKGNSADYRLRWYEVFPDFVGGGVTIGNYTELRDLDWKIPWPIVNQHDRTLTGTDFDPESFQMAYDGTLWFGEEYGPFLLHTDTDGILLEAPIPTAYPSALAPLMRERPFIQSPEHPDFFSLLSIDEREAAANLPSNRGFAGLAINPSRTHLYPLLEGPLSDDPNPNRRLMLEYDIINGRYTERYWFYPVSHPDHSISELVALNENQFLVLERDQREGWQAGFKRIYQIDLRSASPATGMLLSKELVVDLLRIYDTSGLTSAEPGVVGFGFVFSMPFVTTESIAILDARTILVANDNNYPFSMGRRPGRAIDDTEFALLRLPQPLTLAE